MNIVIPEPALVVLVGPTGSGKTTFARRHFGPFERISSDQCRELVSDDENDQEATIDAFDVLHYITKKRLQRSKLVVVDATNVRAEARRPLISLAREHQASMVAIVFNLGEQLCRERNRARSSRSLGPHVVRYQKTQLQRSLPDLNEEGFQHVYLLNTPAEVDAVKIVRDRSGY